MSENQVIYVPGSSVKEVTGQFGSLLKVSFKAEELGKFVKEHKNAKGYINLTISARKTVGQYGDTHSVKLDNWTPDNAAAKSESKPVQKASTKKAPEPAAEDDLPF